MYAYLVVLMLNGTYAVQAPNTVFEGEGSCLKYKEQDTKRLKRQKVDDEAKFFTTCIKIDFEMGMGTGT